MGYFENFLLCQAHIAIVLTLAAIAKSTRRNDAKNVPMASIGCVLHVRKWDSIPGSAVVTMGTPKSNCVISNTTMIRPIVIGDLNMKRIKVLFLPRSLDTTSIEI